MRATWLVLVLAALAGCGAERDSKAEQAHEDARAVAAVEAAQNRQPPVQMLTLEPVTFEDIEKRNLLGASCAFLPARLPEASVVVAMRDRAVVKLDGEITVLAADSGSSELPLGAREVYTGKVFTLHLSRPTGEGTAAGEETLRWPATLTLHDRWERPVYKEAGALECGA